MCATSVLGWPCLSGERRNLPDRLRLNRNRKVGTGVALAETAVPNLSPFFSSDGPFTLIWTVRAGVAGTNGTDGRSSSQSLRLRSCRLRGHVQDGERRVDTVVVLGWWWWCQGLGCCDRGGGGEAPHVQLFRAVTLTLRTYFALLARTPLYACLFHFLVLRRSRPHGDSGAASPPNGGKGDGGEEGRGSETGSGR